MLTSPENIDSAALLQLIETQYRISGHPLYFAPAGEDSWCYRLGPVWISLRRDLRGHLPAAYAAARELALSGLDFVLAPLAGRDGQVVHQASGYPLLVFHYIECTTLEAPAPTEQEVARAVAMLSRVHRAKTSLDLPVDSFVLSFARDLDEALDAAARPLRRRGPFSHAIHQVLRACGEYIGTLRKEYDALAIQCLRNPGAPVLTHGEPISSNFLRHAAGLMIGDWGDLMWGPPERDWSHIIRTFGVGPRCRPEFKRLYDIRWILSEIAEYATIFLAEHGGNADHQAMWNRLLRHLPPAHDQPVVSASS